MLLKFRGISLYVSESPPDLSNPDGSVYGEYIGGKLIGSSAQEIIDARQGEVTLGANITEIKLELEQRTKKGDIVVDIRDFGAIADFDYDTKNWNR